MIEAKVTGGEQVVAHISAMGEAIRAALRASMQQQLFRLQAEVVTGKLSGDPLHRRTGVLASSINTKFEEDVSSITGQVGTKVRYAAVHEYGGAVQVPEYTRRVSTVFGRAVAEHEVMVRAHVANYPVRSFLRSTLGEMAPSIRAALAASVVQGMKA